MNERKYNLYGHALLLLFVTFTSIMVGVPIIGIMLSLIQGKMDAVVLGFVCLAISTVTLWLAVRGRSMLRITETEAIITSAYSREDTQRYRWDSVKSVDVVGERRPFSRAESPSLILTCEDGRTFDVPSGTLARTDIEDVLRSLIPANVWHDNRAGNSHCEGTVS